MKLYVVNVYGKIDGIWSSREEAEQYVIATYEVSSGEKIPFVEELELK